MRSALTLRGVDRSFGEHRALCDVSIDVHAGGVHALLGPNGSGKSTSLRIALGLLKPDRGEVRLLGEVPSGRTRKLRVGYLPEQRSVYVEMRCRDHLVFIGRMRGLDRAEARRRADQWLDTMGLSERARAYAKELSKGMQQKLAIASALLHEPELVILDEPFNGLDPVAQGLLEGLVDACTERGATVILCTHLIEHAERLADRVTLLAQSRVLAEDSIVALRQAAFAGWYEVDFEGSAEWIAGLGGHKTETGWAVQGDGKLLLGRAVEHDVALSRFEAMLPSLRQIVVEHTESP